MTDQAPELLPCPFCGSPAERFDDHDIGSMNEGGSCIQCTLCKASSPMHFDRKENLLSSWNDRVQPVLAFGEDRCKCSQPDACMGAGECLEKAALTARPSDAAVAWRWKVSPHQLNWCYGSDPRHFRPHVYSAEPLYTLPPDEPARVTPSTVGVEDIACEYSGVFGSPPRVCVNKDQCHRVGQCYYKKSPSQPAQNGRLKRSPTIASEKE